MHPKHTSLFPYENRSFANDLKVSDSEYSANQLLTIIFLANLKKGDQLTFTEKASVEVVDVEDGVVSYLVKVEGNDDTLSRASADSVFTTLIGDAMLSKFDAEQVEYNSPYSNVLERDPAVFRKATQTGWVVNDLLALSVGGAQCRGSEIQKILDKKEIQSDVVEEKESNQVAALEEPNSQYSLFD